VTFIVNLPEDSPFEPTTLFGSVGLFSLGGGPVLKGWRLEAIARHSGHAAPIAVGDDNVEEDEVAVWSGADSSLDYLLRTVLTDTWGRTLVGRLKVFGDGPRVRSTGARRAP